MPGGRPARAHPDPAGPRSRAAARHNGSPGPTLLPSPGSPGAVSCREQGLQQPRGRGGGPLPSGSWQAVPQAAGQHLRVLSQSPSDWHPTVQLASSVAGSGHTPAFAERQRHTVWVGTGLLALQRGKGCRLEEGDAASSPWAGARDAAEHGPAGCWLGSPALAPISSRALGLGAMPAARTGPGRALILTRDILGGCWRQLCPENQEPCEDEHAAGLGHGAGEPALRVQGHPAGL